ncbi:MAG: UDP-N-acetylmuramate--L-alanine ligase [Proteobacteria bacterium]|jgi:UDP-N-acetylmuramate--alanine ligase|nr:UDP-N-acetylmuramate--L-alanine ligase [Pseudomonadota bacterium]
MRLQKSKFHFVGIGGIGMCGLAELLHNMGAQVSGSDLNSNANTERLAQLGVKIFKGHSESHLQDADVLVYSSAVQTNNPEVMAARKRKIPMIPRAEALAEIMRLKRGVAVAGTHGKTTTTSMLASIFLEAQSEPTIVIGGRFDLIQSTARLGKGEWLVAEADESDGSFNKLSPEFAIITNIDNDHMDYYKSFENLQKAFVAFANKVPFYGHVAVCGDEVRNRELFQNFSKPISFYGFDEANDFVLKGSQGTYELFENDLEQKKMKKLGSLKLSIPGTHNALNATAAVIIALKAGFSFEVIQKGLERFQGVDRRFHFKGEKAGIKVYDDYGHHPTEVRATLQAFREKFPQARLVVYFQPHRFSRTESCWHDFTQSFGDADVILLADIYPAGESPIEGIHSQRLASEIKHHQVHYIPKESDLLSGVKSRLKSGDVFITLGAGDGWKLGMSVLESLK